MKTFQTETEIAAGGLLILHDLPFPPGERVAVTIASPTLFTEMREYAERMASGSEEFVEESENHTVERLLRDTEW